MLVVGRLENHLNRATFDELAVLVDTHATSRVGEGVDVSDEW